MVGDAWEQCRAQLAGVQDGGGQAAVWDLAAVVGGDGASAAGDCGGGGVFAVNKNNQSF